MRADLFGELLSGPWLSIQARQAWALTGTLLGVGVKEQSTEPSAAPGIMDFLPIFNQS